MGGVALSVREFARAGADVVHVLLRGVGALQCEDRGTLREGAEVFTINLSFEFIFISQKKLNIFALLFKIASKVRGGV